MQPHTGSHVDDRWIWQNSHSRLDSADTYITTHTRTIHTWLVEGHNEKLSRRSGVSMLIID